METSKETIQKNKLEKVKNVLTPNLEQQRAIRSTLKDISYYLIIALISVIVVFVVPLISGCLYGDFDMYFPKTVEGWVVYWCIRGGTAGGNIALFILFKLQAKTNVRKEPAYIEAQEILRKHVGEDVFIPRSPTQKNTKDYIVKISTILVTSILASVTISALAISFDFITFLSCIVSTIIALCFGWVTMLKDEMYWTEEYLEYAKYMDKKLTEASAEKPQETIQTAPESNVSDSAEELSKEVEKEAENA